MTDLFVVSSRSSQSGNVWAVLAVDGIDAETLASSPTREFYRARVSRMLPAGTRIRNVELNELPIPAETLPAEAGAEDQRPVVFTTVQLVAGDSTTVEEPYQVPVSVLPAATRAAAPRG